MQGHVNNAVIVDYLQQARVAFWHGSPLAHSSDEGSLVISNQVEYLAPISYRDGAIDIALSIGSVGGAKFEVAYQLSQRGEPVANARTTMCPFDFGSQQPRRLTPEQRQYLAKYETALPALRDLPQLVPGKRSVSVPVQVRWSDLDAYGHVNNVAMYEYVQEARVVATQRIEHDLAGMSEASSSLWLVVRQDVDYLQQLHHRLEPYEMQVTPVALGRSSVTLVSELVDEDQVRYATGTTVLVYADAAGRPKELADDMRSLLQRWGEAA